MSCGDDAITCLWQERLQPPFPTVSEPFVPSPILFYWFDGFYRSAMIRIRLFLVV